MQSFRNILFLSLLEIIFASYNQCFSDGFNNSDVVVKGFWKKRVQYEVADSNKVSCPIFNWHHNNCGHFHCDSKCYRGYIWTTTGCKSEEFDAELFLKTLENKRLALVGDSMARQHFASLSCLLFDYLAPTYDAQIKDLQMQYSPHLNVSCPLFGGKDVRCLSFRFNVTICAGPINIENSDLTVFNTGGIHFPNKTEYKDNLEKQLSHFKYSKYFPYGNKLLIFRETSPQAFKGIGSGYYEVRESIEDAEKCMSASNLANDDSGTDIRFSYTDMFTNVTRWFMPWRQRLERDIIERAGIPYWKIYKLSHTLPCDGLGHVGFEPSPPTPAPTTLAPAIRRNGSNPMELPPAMPDFRLDCTHFCLPGVPDVWSYMLYNFVRHSPLMALIKTS